MKTDSNDDPRTKVEIEQDQQKINRNEEGPETIQDFDIDESISNLD